MEIFSKLGGAMVSRWGHVLAGVTWIGLLYYFNFVQVPSFATFDAAPRTEAIRKLVPRALWWFRWAAALTVLTGIMILGFQEQFKGDYFKSIGGTSILTGILLAVTMFLNVWGVIWPNQKVVIASAERVAAGGDVDPAAAGAGRKAFLASRTNTLFSIPMLWFMVATSHFYTQSTHFRAVPGGSHLAPYWIIVIVIWAAIEANALGLLGGTGPGPARQPLEKHRDTIISGLVLWAVLYGLTEIFLRA